MDDIFFYVLCAILGLLLVGFVAYVLFHVTNFLVRLIFFRFSFGPLSESTGKVTDMEYVPPRTTYNGKTTTTTPEKNHVYFKTDQGETSLDSDELYQRVRIGEDIQVKYQERFKKPRFWNGKWKEDGLRLISVTNKYDDTVDFNDEKPVLSERERRQ